MEISKAAVGCLVGLCVAAGAGATYFAVHDPTSAAPLSLSRQETTVAGGAESLSNPGVEQSEAVLTEPAAPKTPAVNLSGTPPRRPVSTQTRSGARPAPEKPATSERSPHPSSSAPEHPAGIDTVQPSVIIPIEPPLITDNQPSQSVVPPGPKYEDLVVAADSVIGLELESTVNSERAKVEDQVTARVTRDVKVGGRIAIPAGSRAQGEVTLVERGGRLRDRARLGVRFTSVVLADGTRLPLRTETIYRDGDAPSGESTAKIGGGAIGGAILGGILGGAKGAAIGGSVGAGAGSAAVLAGGRNPATLSAGSPVTVRVEEPVTVTVTAERADQ